MQKIKMAKNVLVGLFIPVFIFSPVQFNASSARFVIENVFAGTPDDYGIVGEAILIEEDTLLPKGSTASFDKKVFIVNGATLTVEAGVTVILGNNNPDDGHIGYLGVLDGSLKVVGTEKEPVVFSGKDGYGFFMEFYNENQSNDPSFVRHAIIAGGGGKFDGGGFIGQSRKTVFQKALAGADGWGALKYYSGKAHIENTTFSGNAYADIEIENPLFDATSTANYLEVVNSNFGDNQDQTAISVNDAYCSADHCGNRVFLKNNWYGSPAGPRGIPEQNPGGDGGDGAYIRGQVNFDGHRKSGVIADPLIVVPGITGSAQVLGAWKIDPITHIYDDLIDSLTRNGYEDGVNLFTFPYEWRNNNETSALYLQSKIEGVLQETDVSKVDVVAHSMGGLVARAYVEEISGTHYDDTIDQLITIGTPHNGSPEAYLKWEAGEGFFRLDGILAKHHFEQEAEEAGYNNDLQGYIRDRVLSVRELLPAYDYLFDIASGNMRAYPDNYPRNTFLEELNSAQNKAKLAGIDYTNIIGRTTPEKTIARMRVQESTMPGTWEHGMPENFYATDTDQGLGYGAGDETVPQSSARIGAADTVIELDATHNDLPTKAQCEIFRALTAVQACDYEENWHMPNILLFNVFSPIDIQIVSPSGKKIGKNFETGGIYDEIPGAYYTGYDTENEFITVPNPEDGEYHILTQGTGDGEYRIEAVHIAESDVQGGDATETVAAMTGVAATGVADEKIVTLENNALSAAEADTTIPEITITSPENKEYINDEHVPVTYAVTDNVSSEDKIAKAAELDGEIFDQAAIDLSLNTLGDHALAVRATDEAGNEAMQTVTFENTATFSSLQNNIDHYFSLGLIKKKNDAKHIKVFLRHIQRVREILDVLRRMPYIHPRVRAHNVRHLQRELERNKKSFIQYLSKKVEKGIIASQAKDRIVEAVEMLVQ